MTTFDGYIELSGVEEEPCWLLYYRHGSIFITYLPPPVKKCRLFPVLFSPEYVRKSTAMSAGEILRKYSASDMFSPRLQHLEANNFDMSILTKLSTTLAQTNLAGRGKEGRKKERSRLMGYENLRKDMTNFPT